MFILKKIMSVMTLVLICNLVLGCAAFRSDISGGVETKLEKNYGAKPVSVLFIFNHSRFRSGFDAIPKLNTNRQILSGFNDIFFDALQDISNVRSYATFTEFSSDVNNPARRAQKDSLIAASDYVIKMKFRKETSFVNNFLGNLLSIVTATLIPVPYTQSLTLDTKVFDNSGALVAQFNHEAKVSTWVEAFLIVIYPFHTEKRKTEEIYVAIMHDVFRQIDSQKILQIQ